MINTNKQIVHNKNMNISLKNSLNVDIKKNEYQIFENTNHDDILPPKSAYSAYKYLNTKIKNYKRNSYQAELSSSQYTERSKSKRNNKSILEEKITIRDNNLSIYL
jgi:hypothetical protein